MNDAGRTADVSGKTPALRRAVAASALSAPPEIIARIRDNDLPKKDPIATARAAAMLAAKNTANLIPHCHPISITSVDIEFRFEEARVGVTCEVKAFDRTGPEMEALVGAAVAVLTLYDMVKGISRGARIDSVALLEKEGGKSGRWRAGGGDG